MKCQKVSKLIKSATGKFCSTSSETLSSLLSKVRLHYRSDSLMGVLLVKSLIQVLGWLRKIRQSSSNSLESWKSRLTSTREEWDLASLSQKWFFSNLKAKLLSNQSLGWDQSSLSRSQLMNTNSANDSLPRCREGYELQIERGPQTSSGHFLTTSLNQGNITKPRMQMHFHLMKISTPIITSSKGSFI